MFLSFGYNKSEGNKLQKENKNKDEIVKKAQESRTKNMFIMRKTKKKNQIFYLNENTR